MSRILVAIIASTAVLFLGTSSDWALALFIVISVMSLDWAQMLTGRPTSTLPRLALGALTGLWMVVFTVVVGDWSSSDMFTSLAQEVAAEVNFPIVVAALAAVCIFVGTFGLGGCVWVVRSWFEEPGAEATGWAAVRRRVRGSSGRTRVVSARSAWMPVGPRVTTLAIRVFRTFFEQSGRVPGDAIHMCTLLLLGLTYSAGGLVALVLPNITPLLKYYEPSSTVAAVATLSLTVMWGGHISAAAYSVFGAWEKMLFLVATLVCAWVGPCVATEVGLQLTGGGYSIISEGWPLIWVALLVVLAFWWDADTWTARLARAVVWIGAVGLLSVNEWLSWDHSALRFVVLLTVGWVALAGVRMYIPQSNSVLGFTVSGLRRKALALGVASILGATTLAIGGYYLREAGVLALADMYLAWAAAMLLFISGAILPVGASMNYSLTVAMSRLALGAESES